jgi:hypothetical protein
MKTLSYFLMVATVSSVTFSSCKKDSTPAPAPKPTEIASSTKLTSNGKALSFNVCEEYTASTNAVTQTLFIANNVTNGKVSDEQFEVDVMDDPSTFKAGQTHPMATSFVQKGGGYSFLKS